MELREISLAQLLNNTSGTEYFAVFAKLIGHSEGSIFYEGINDSHMQLVEELESILERQIPSHYLEFLSYLNGGHFLNVDLFSLANNEYSNSLVSRNYYSKIRSELEIEDNVLIIGKFENYIIYVDCDEVDGTYTLMDIRNNEKIEFESLGALVGFIFYIFLLKENEKLEKEKEQIKEMREKLHNEFKKKGAIIKKEKEKNKQKLMAKVSSKALKEALKKKKR